MKSEKNARQFATNWQKYKRLISLRKAQEPKKCSTNLKENNEEKLKDFPMEKICQSVKVPSPLPRELSPSSSSSHSFYT